MYPRGITARLLLCISMLPTQFGWITAQDQPVDPATSSWQISDLSDPLEVSSFGESSSLEAPLALEYEGWPMSGANPQRTSWASEDLSSQVSAMDVEWTRPIEAFIPPASNLIATNGMIYVSTARGLYALDAETGALNWRYDTDMPLGNSPTVVGGVAYVGGFDRQLHALDANNGDHLWSFAGAGAGYDTNPLVISDEHTGNQPIVFLGNRDGSFYAIGGHGHSRQGELLWSYETGGPIHFSAAYSEGKLFFASSDNYAYALNTNGVRIWKSAQLFGDGFHAYWPVVVGDKVVFSGSPAYRSNANPGLESFRDADGNFAARVSTLDSMAIFEGDESGLHLPELSSQPWSNGMPVVDGSAITEYYEENPSPDPYKHKPWRRMTFLLHQTDGSEYTFDSDGDGYVEYIPFPRHGTRQMNNYPPIVAPDGMLYSAVMFSTRTETDSFIMGWREGTHLLSKLGPSSRSALVEPHALSGGGSMMFRNLCCDRIGAYFGYQAGSPSGTFWSYDLWNHSPNYDLMWEIGFGSSRGDRLRGWFNSSTDSPNGIYHNHGYQTPLIPYQGRIYTHRSNAIIAIGTGALNEEPFVAIQEATSTTQALVSSDLVSLLEDEVQKLITAGLLRPGYYDHRIGNNTELRDYFENPGDTLYTLSIAYPHLEPELQGDLKDYLSMLFREYFNPTMYATIGWIDGAPREWMPMPPEIQAKLDNPDPEVNNDNILFKRTVVPSPPRSGWSYPPHNLYALYVYAKNIPEQDRESNALVYDLAKSRIDEALENSTSKTNQSYLESPFQHNAILAGYIGYLELQDIAGVDSYQRTEVQAELNRLLNLRWQLFDKDSPWIELGRYHRKTLDVARNFLYLVPELGELYRQNILNQVSDAINEYELIAPYWFVSRFEAVLGEGAMQTLLNSPAIFQAKAWILHEPMDELQKYIDVPAFKRGDLFYIQNLVAAIEAGQPLQPAAAPRIDPAAGIYDHSLTVSLSSTSEIARIHFTLDGTTPTQFSTLYTEPFVIHKSTLVKARAYEDGFSPSSVSTADFDLETIFEDVPYDHWAYDYIEALAEAGYVSGCSQSPPLYCPDTVLNRAESSVFVLRGEYGPIGDPPHPPPQSATFSDVLTSFWGFNWIESLWQDGFTSGCNLDPLMFCPDQEHTRAEASVFFLRVMHGSTYEPPEAEGLFSDVNADAWYFDWVEAAYDHGLLLACNTDPLEICPEELVDRSWSAFMMVEAMGGLEAFSTSTPTPQASLSQITPTPTPSPIGNGQSSITPTPTSTTESPTPSATPTPEE